MQPLHISLGHSILLVMITASNAVLIPGAREYCEAEEFLARCKADEVVVMETALYGRMSVGRCVIKDYGYVGCKADVLEHMDNKCSGRRSCEIRIPDSTLDDANPCPKDFKTFLEASYKCVKVDNPPCRPCKNFTEVIATSPQGFLASIVSEENNCGTANCPYLLSARPGQSFNFTLVDFALSPKRRSTAAVSNMEDFCYRYATMREQGLDKEIFVCGGTQRVRFSYTSQTNVVRIKFEGGRHGGAFGHFLLKYDVLGCAEYEPPRNTWMKPEGSDVIVGCVSTGVHWRVTCHDKLWVGEVGDCPPGGPVSVGSSTERSMALPLGILIAIILAIAMVIGVFILTCGLVFIKRRRMAASSPATTGTVALSRDPYYKGQQFSHYGTGSRRSTKDYGGRVPYSKEYDPRLPKAEFLPDCQAQTLGRYQPGLPFEDKQLPRRQDLELRPLPSIPDLNCSVVHHEPELSPPMSAGIIPTMPSDEDLPNAPHYFELDPDMRGPPFRNHARHVPLIHKSPEQENAENTGKESYCWNPPRPAPPINNAFVFTYNESANCSWP